MSAMKKQIEAAEGVTEELSRIRKMEDMFTTEMLRKDEEIKSIREEMSKSLSGEESIKLSECKAELEIENSKLIERSTQLEYELKVDFIC
jgi:predicted AAA+ superfamily ATPase